MRAISLWQPWASLIAQGEKEYETRHWRPRGVLKRGDMLAIHAAKAWDKDTGTLCYSEPFKSVLLRHGIQFPAAQLPRGAMLCICQFVDIFHTEDVERTLSRQELAFGNYGRKRFAWQLKVVHVFPAPIPASGQQGIFEWELPAESGDADGFEVAPMPIVREQVMKLEQLRLF